MLKVEEQLKKIKKLISKIEDLELYEKLDEITYDLCDDLKENAILDVEIFKRQLEQQNLMSRELVEFIENYMRFDNVC